MRRWTGDRAPVVEENAFVQLITERNRDLGPIVDELIPFGLAVTLTMPGVSRYLRRSSTAPWIRDWVDRVVVALDLVEAGKKAGEAALPTNLRIRGDLLSSVGVPSWTKCP